VSRHDVAQRVAVERLEQLLGGLARAGE